MLHYRFSIPKMSSDDDVMSEYHISECTEEQLKARVMKAVRNDNVEEHHDLHAGHILTLILHFKVTVPYDITAWP